MKKTFMLLAFATILYVPAQAQENVSGKQHNFQHHAIGLSLYGNFFENRSSFSAVDFTNLEFHHQLVNGIQYTYRLDEHNALRGGFTYFGEKKKLKEYHNMSVKRAGIYLGYEHQWGKGKWRPYMFGEFSYQQSLQKDTYDMTHVNTVGNIIAIEPRVIHVQNKFYDYGLTAGAGIRYHCCKHIFVGLETSASFAMYRNSYSSDYPSTSKGKGNLLTLSPVRFVSVGVSF